MSILGLFSLLADVPTPGAPEDFASKALTQGGLLCVVMVLLYWQWWQQKQVAIDQKARETEKNTLVTELMRIAERSAVAAEANVQVTRANTDAVRDLTAAVRKG